MSTNKRSRVEDSSLAHTNIVDASKQNEIAKLLQELSNKMDGLSGKSVLDIDAKLTAKIDNLELALGNQVKAVKEEAEYRLIKFSTEVKARFEDVTHSVSVLRANMTFK